MIFTKAVSYDGLIFASYKFGVMNAISYSSWVNFPLKVILLVSFAFVSTGCEELKQKLSSLGNGSQEVIGEVSDADLIKNGVPVTNSFNSIGPTEFHSLKARTDQVTVVEFYSDT